MTSAKATNRAHLSSGLSLPWAMQVTATSLLLLMAFKGIMNFNAANKNTEQTVKKNGRHQRCEPTEVPTTQKTTDSHWRFAGASVVGSSHIKSQAPCQDAFQYKALATGEVVIAVSDGAGSATKAEEGSTFIATKAVECVEQLLAQTTPGCQEDWLALVRTAFAATRNALSEKAVADEAPLRAYAATLILVILTKDWTVCGLIGDCAAIILNQVGELCSLCTPQKGEYANTTNFLTQSDALECLNIQIKAESAQGAVILSDGLLNLALNLASNEPHPGFFQPLFAFLTAIQNEQEATTQLAAFLKSDRVNARTDDDKTVVIVSKA